jgi:SAM-dependent methyltransferase
LARRNRLYDGSHFRKKQPSEQTMAINYDHARNRHTLVGASAALKIIFDTSPPKSILDVGCGAGTWMRAAVEQGVTDVVGVDGVEVPEDRLYVPRSLIKVLDLSETINLGRHFDVAFCLEVAEHLPEVSAEKLISSIAGHADNVLFSAACPNQPGQHHINCQWPAYWQTRFNEHGYICDDSVRWQIWADERIEPWYRQNLFWARRDRNNAGKEPRLKDVIHPAMFDAICAQHMRNMSERLRDIEQGSQRWTWYGSLVARVLWVKLGRVMSSQNKR